MGKQRHIKADRAAKQAIRRQLVGAGVVQRIEKVRAALQSPFFAPTADARLLKLGTAVKTHDDVRDALLALLREGWGLDTTDVNLKIIWAPDSNRMLSVTAVPGAQATLSAFRAARARGRAA